MGVVGGGLPSHVVAVVDGEQRVLLLSAGLKLHPELELDVLWSGCSLVGAVKKGLLVVLDERLDGLGDLPLVNVPSRADELGVDGLVIVAALGRGQHALDHCRTLLRRRRPNQEVTVINEGLLTVACIGGCFLLLLDWLW